MATKRFAALALAGAMLMGACGQQPVTSTPVANQPVEAPATPAKALGLYELSISNVNGKVISSVSRVGGGQLSAQEISGLTFSVSNVTVQNTVDPQHYTANLTMTNGSGAPVNYPLVVPVAVSGYTDTDSSGKPTYFRNTANASGTAVKPDGLDIEQATYDSGGTATPDATAPRLVPTPNSITTFGFDVPSGTAVSQVSPLAWLGTTVAAGASATTSIGFKFPKGSPIYRFSVIFGVFDGAAAQPGRVIISEFRFRGPSGAADEFIELFNAGLSDVDISGYKVDGNTNNSASWGSRATIPQGKTLAPGQFYLVYNNNNNAAGGYSGTVTGDQSYVTGITDNRAVRVTDSAGVVKDLVGFATAGKSSAALCEGADKCLTDGSTSSVTTQISWARKVTNNIIQDTDKNADDFEFRDGTSKSANPQSNSMNFSTTGLN